jgi:hypothetical protein
MFSHFALTLQTSAAGLPKSTRQWRQPQPELQAPHTTNHTRKGEKAESENAERDKIEGCVPHS